MKTDIMTREQKLEHYLREFMKRACAEEGQSWGFDFIISEDTYGKIQELLNGTN
jgi:hypothetical protein